MHQDVNTRIVIHALRSSCFFQGIHAVQGPSVLDADKQLVRLVMNPARMQRMLQQGRSYSKELRQISRAQMRSVECNKARIISECCSDSMTVLGLRMQHNLGPCLIRFARAPFIDTCELYRP